MNELEHTAWRILSWVLTASPIVYIVFRGARIIDYPNDGWNIVILVFVAFIAMTARKFMDS